MLLGVQVEAPHIRYYRPVIPPSVKYLDDFDYRYRPVTESTGWEYKFML